MKYKKTYQDKLEDDKWLRKRRRIIRRDGGKCKICSSKENLNVHHRYYIHGNEPWNYNDNGLVTLCENCHKLVHETLAPLVYIQRSNNLTIMNFTPCKRCGGYGYLSEYRHIQNGICFRCRGQKYEELINIKSIERYIDKK